MSLLPANRMASAQSDSGVNPLILPPAVAYPLAPARALRRLLALVWLWIVAVDAYWLGVAPAGDWRPWATLLVSLVVGALAWHSRPLTQSGVLAWDGARWWWERPSSSVPGRVAVRLDTQSGLLLHFLADTGATCWFWLDRSGNPARWLALRRAAHAAPGLPAVPDKAATSGAVLR